MAALVHADPALVATRFGPLVVRHADELAEVVAEAQIAIGVITTPAGAAQGVADALVEAGVRSILNFAPTVIAVPDDVSLRKVYLAVAMQILSFYQRQASTSTR